MNEIEVRRRLQMEFAVAFATQRNILPFFPHVVVFLSAPQDMTRNPGDPAYEMSTENVTRAMYSVLLAETQGSDVSTLVLDGETEQLQAMEKLVRDLGFRRSVSINSGDRGQSHTGTQFLKFAAWLQEQPFQGRAGLVFVTNQYHIPRVNRYAARHIPRGDFNWYVAGVPNDTCLYDRATKVAGEIEKIIRYAAQGIFDLFPSV